MIFCNRQIELIEENKSLKRIVEARVKKGYGSFIDTEKYLVVSRERMKNYVNDIEELRRLNTLYNTDRFLHTSVKDVIKERDELRKELENMKVNSDINYSVNKDLKEKLEFERQEREKEYNDFSIEINRLKRHRDELKESISAEQTKSANEFNDFSFQIHELKQKRDELSQGLENTNNALTLSDSIKNELKNERERLNNRVNELLEIEQKYKKQGFQIASRDTTIKMRDNQLAHKQGTLIKQSNKIMELNDTVKDLEKVIVELRQDANALQGVANDFEKENTNMGKRIEVLVDRQSNYQCQVRDLNNELLILKNENFILRTSKMDINKHLDTISALGGEIADNRVFINEIQTKLMNRDTVIDQYRERGWKVLEEHNKAIQELQTRHVEEIKDSQDFIDIQRGTIDQLKNGSKLATEIINELRDSLDESRDDRSRLINRTLIQRILNY